MTSLLRRAANTSLQVKIHFGREKKKTVYEKKKKKMADKFGSTMNS